MKIEVENLGAPRQDFQRLRDDLVAQGRKFDETHLPSIPYQELILCCTGPAGEAACLPRLVRAEKVRRRERFLGMEQAEFDECLNFLRVEEMEADINFALAQRAAPNWDDLSARQKLWFKLSCIYNHVDAPHQRLGEAILLLRKCMDEVDSGLPREVCEHYMNKLRQYHADFPAVMKENQFREKVWDIAETILEFLPDEEVGICKKELLQNYSCTSDCFRVTWD
jgi:hypothetical protein